MSAIGARHQFRPYSRWSLNAGDGPPCGVCWSASDDPIHWSAPTSSGHWRIGRKLGRTLYLNDQVIGMVDTPELAAAIVAAMNARNGPPFTDTGGRSVEVHELPADET